MISAMGTSSIIEATVSSKNTPQLFQFIEKLDCRLTLHRRVVARLFALAARTTSDDEDAYLANVAGFNPNPQLSRRRLRVEIQRGECEALDALLESTDKSVFLFKVEVAAWKELQGQKKRRELESLASLPAADSPPTAIASKPETPPPVSMLSDEDLADLGMI